MTQPTEAPGPTQFAVSGYYGCGNAGDEAVLAGIQESFARADSSVSLVALSQDPEATTQSHRIRSVYRMNAAALRQVLRESTGLLSGGGSLLQDTTSVRSLLYYLWVCRLAYSAGVPFAFYAQGIGPLRRPMSRALVRIVADRAAIVTVRDAPSAELLTGIGVTRADIEVTADPAFALTPSSTEETASLLALEGLYADEPMVALALRPWSGEAPLDVYSTLADEMAARAGARVVLIPMQKPADVDLANRVADGCHVRPHVLQGSYSPRQLMGIVGAMRAAAAMRLHTLIFAARAGTPCFALSYDPKVEHLMNRLGMADLMEHWKGFDPGEVAQRVAGIASEKEERAKQLAASAEEMERLAIANALSVLNALRSAKIGVV